MSERLVLYLQMTIHSLKVTMSASWCISNATLLEVHARYDKFMPTVSTRWSSSTPMLGSVTHYAWIPLKHIHASETLLHTHAWILIFGQPRSL